MNSYTKENTALLVVDMQVGEQMSFNKPTWDRVAASVSWLLESARRVHFPVIHVYLGEDERNGELLRCRRGGQVPVRSASHRIVHECLPIAGEWGYPKTGSDAFARENFLANSYPLSSVENLIICGVLMTDCIKATALGARRNLYNVLVPPEATAGMNLSSAENAEVLQQLSTHGVDVRSIDQVTALFPT